MAERIDGVESELVRYGYSADGRLGYRKQASPLEELYLVSDGDQVVIERTSSAVQRTSVWASATLLKTRAVGGLELHLHQDRLGSVVLATQAGSSGAELHRRVQFDPYGRRVSSGAWEGPGRWDRYGYAGARWDATVGLYLMGARWYAPEMGRFLELDPIGEGGGWNLYNYVGSSPTMWVDPTGLKWKGSLVPANARSSVRHPAAMARTGTSMERKLLGSLARSERGIPCYVCNNADEDPDQGESSDETDDSSDESGGKEKPGGEQQSGGEEEPVDGKELGDTLTRINSMQGSAEQVRNQLRSDGLYEKYSKIVSGKKIGIYRGADNNESSAAVQPLQANAERLEAILFGLGADVMVKPLTEQTGNELKFLDAAVFFVHDLGGVAPLEGKGGEYGDGFLTTAEVSGWRPGLVRDGGVAIWVGCDTAGGDRSFVDSSGFNRSGWTGGTTGGVFYAVTEFYRSSDRERLNPVFGRGAGAIPGGEYYWAAPEAGGMR